MERYFDQFNEVSLADSDRLARDDLNHEIAGLRVGRRLRFGVGGPDNAVDGEGKSKKERIARTLEWLLLNDSDYKRLHGEAMAALQLAEEATRNALDRIETELAAIRGVLEDVLDNAATLPDGTKVFKDANCVVKDEGGNAIADDLAATIIWQDDSPTYEEYRAASDRTTALENTALELHGIEVEIGGYRGELTNNEEPVSKGRIRSITDRVTSLDERTKEIAPLEGLASSSNQGTEFERSDAAVVSVPVIKVGQ